MSAIEHVQLRARQVPLAAVMVFLTTLTLWSLGQAIVVSVPADGVGQARRMMSP